MPFQTRDATPDDAPAVVALVHELAAAEGDTSPLSPAYVGQYLSHPGSGLLLAEEDGQAIGLLGYSVRPDLYHAGPGGLIELLIVHGPYRGRGVGHALLSAFLHRAQSLGCIEVSVTTGMENHAAQRLYRAHGLVDEALLLEKHLGG
jgi:ribosomal protein S18 acetylase RimI-like enzyme